MSALLDAGADINARDVWGSTALIAAAQYRQEAAALALLGRGAPADAGATNERGAGALLHAAEAGCAPLLRALLAAGAPPRPPPAWVYNAAADENQLLVPLSAAAANGHDACVEALLAGACAVRDVFVCTFLFFCFCVAVTHYLCVRARVTCVTLSQMRARVTLCVRLRACVRSWCVRVRTVFSCFSACALKCMCMRARAWECSFVRVFGGCDSNASRA
jgi:ankyrin repeat protein